MASLISDLGLAEIALADISAFAAGQPVTTSRSIGGVTYTISVVVLPNGPTAPYVEIKGGFLAIFELVLSLLTEFTTGGSIAIAEKVGATWYGTTLTPSAPVAA